MSLQLLVFCSVFAGGGALTSKDSDEIAIKTGDKSSYVKINELWSSEAEVFNTTNLRKLLNYITNSSNTGETNSEVLSSIKTTLNSGAITASDIRASTYGNKTNSQSVVVRLGGLDWIVTYVSTDTEGNVIATLWLSNNVQDTFKNRSQTEGELYGYLDGGLYSDWSDDWYYNSGNSWEMPSNMYGTSYIRAVTLNNGGTYASYTGNNPGEVTDSSLIKSETAIKNSASAFAPFTMGALTNYIVKPSAVSWQKEQSAVTTLSGWTSVKCPNDEWQTSSSGYYTDSQGRNYNYSSLANYSAWNADNIWLPSITETGYSENTNRTGLWALSNTERMNYDGSTTSNLSTSGVGSNNKANVGAYAYSWLRSGEYNNSNYSYRLGQSGSYCYSKYNYVSYSRAVRPALHLNITKIYNSLEKIEDAKITQKQTCIYNGSEQKPDFNVVLNNKTLTNGTDYTISYQNNINAGQATATIVGIGDYIGSQTVTFTIEKQVVVPPTLKPEYYILAYTGGEQRITAEMLRGFDSTIMKLTSDTGTNVGTYSVRIELLYPNNYKWKTT